MLSIICVMANARENVIYYTKNFLFLQNMCRNLKFLAAEKIRLKKKQTMLRSAW
jgi:hypothetical protein